MFLKREIFQKKFWFWEIFVEALTRFRVFSSNQNLARALTSTQKKSRANKFAMLLSNSSDEHRGLRQFSEAGCRHQMTVVPPNEMFTGKKKL